MASGVFVHQLRARLVFDNVKVRKKNILPNVKGLKGTTELLNKGPVWIAWGTFGAAMDCYEHALRYSKKDTIK
jgi:glutaryl-CoA dehydrogenase